MRKTIIIISLVALLTVVLTYGIADAKVTGPCSNCHTMHNSQQGAHMQYLAPGEEDIGPKGALLRGTCLGCHTATDGSTWKSSITGAPIVFNTSEPVFNEAKGLAAGNFYWVQTEDTKGHNIFSQDSKLSVAPGDMGFSGCGTNNCHTNFHLAVSGTGNPALDGKQGCTKCHMVNTVGPKGFHHKDDGTGTKYVDTAEKGWYRFLEGHMSGSGHGVAGIEDDDWQYTYSSTDHNEYLGSQVSGGYGFGGLGNTMTAYCTGCHGVFHDNQGTASPWLRHPSDKILPTSGEYAAYTTYDPLVPVARPSSFDWEGGPSSMVSGTHGDMVMCLSCHRAHASPYFKMMRWDYRGWPGSGATNGCNVCHTSKN
ncbi:MAG: hypothetical protein IBX72_03410 [Nitrospirae bacterium]|nr:hypothetical protein [Nitrospirota bacterium]